MKIWNTWKNFIFTEMVDERYNKPCVKIRNMERKNEQRKF